MTTKDDSLFPPPDLSWRPLRPADAAAITALAEATQAADGGLSLPVVDAYVQEQDRGAPPWPAIGAFDMDGRLVACAAVRPAHTPQEYRADIAGQVHPAERGRGLGGFLLGWSVEQARALLAACPPDRPHILRLGAESLTGPAARLYERHGFTQQFAEDVMRHDLGLTLPEAAFPPGVRLAAWAPALAEQFFAVYQAAFRERPGFPGWSAGECEWIAWAAGGDDLRPEMSLLALHGELPVGFIVCADEWIVQVGVRPEWRGRGLGAALVAEALRRFRDAGCARVLLDVNVNNPGAARVYARLGFTLAGRRARYVRALQR
jgi:mycothiol synthase